MLSNRASTFIEQLGNLLLCQPHRFILQADVKIYLPVVGLVDDYLTVIGS